MRFRDAGTLAMLGSRICISRNFGNFASCSLDRIGVHSSALSHTNLFLEHCCCSHAHSARNRSDSWSGAFQKPTFGLAVRVAALYLCVLVVDPPQRLPRRVAAYAGASAEALATLRSDDAVDRVAVLVDAGYFFAAGSALISGTGKQPRHTVTFDATRAADALKSFALAVSGGLALLRIYWYDGASRKTGPSDEHMRLAYADDIKVRLGFLNAAGEQKGVDSLIVTDMVELARNRAITDMVLLSGDEDVRIGVQLVQSFGVRVHLLGIEPCADTQSAYLRQEADSCLEWDASVVGKIISLRADSVAGVVSNSASDTAKLDRVVEQLLGGLGTTKNKAASTYMLVESNKMPRELDGKLLARCRTALGRNLDDASRRYVRSRVRQRVRRLAAQNA